MGRGFWLSRIDFRLWHTFIKIWIGTRTGKGRNFAWGLGRIGYSDMSW